MIGAISWIVMFSRIEGLKLCERKATESLQVTDSRTGSNSGWSLFGLVILRSLLSRTTCEIVLLGNKGLDVKPSLSV